MKKLGTKLAAAMLSAAVAGAVGGCAGDAAAPAESTKQGSGQMKNPAGMERPQPTGTGGAVNAPVESTKTGSGAMKTPAGMAKPTPEPTPTAADLTHVLTADAPYYKSSPAQGKPADGTLKAGTKVLLLMPAGSYSQVWAENGVKGYVPTANIQAK